VRREGESPNPPKYATAYGEP